LLLLLLFAAKADSSFRFRKLEPLHHIGRNAGMTSKK
jgi:hypothetical protein